MPNYDYSIPMLVQHLILFNSTAALAIYYLLFLQLELDFGFGKFFRPRFLIISVVFAFVVFYLGTYFLTGSLDTARKVYIGFPTLLITYFCFKIIKVLFRDKNANTNNKNANSKHFRFLRITGTLGFIFMATMPYVLIIGFDQKGWSHLLINMALLMSALGYFKSYFLNYKRQRTVFNNQVNPELDLRRILTNREFELSYLLVRKELSYIDIGKMMYISEGTVSKHASNIYRKTGVNNRAAFILKYLLDHPRKSA